MQSTDETHPNFPDISMRVTEHHSAIPGEKSRIEIEYFMKAMGYCGISK